MNKKVFTEKARNVCYFFSCCERRLFTRQTHARAAEGMPLFKCNHGFSGH